MITSEVLESFSNIFQVLYPLRLQKNNLREVFLKINKLRRVNFPYSIIKKFSLLRNILEVYVNSTLEYLYIDLLQPLWAEFYSEFLKMTDFDDLRKSVSALVRNIFEGLFWEYNQIGFCFRRLNYNIGELINLLEISFESTPDKIIHNLNLLHSKIYKNFGELVTALFIIIDIGKAEFASKLFLKLNFNDYFKNYIQDKAE